MVLAERESPNAAPKGVRDAPKRRRWRSGVWTALLVPFLFLPYRWLWVPCGLAGMVLAWPTSRRWSEVMHRDGTLIVGSVVVLVLRTALDPAWCLPWVAVFASLWWLRSRSWWSTKLALPTVAVVWFASVALLLRPTSWPFRSRSGWDVPSEAVLVCAGDSLTSGLTPGSDDGTYVARLRERLGCTVINAGVAGNRTGDLLARLSKDVLSRRPTAVLLFIGGNDYLDGTPRRKFAAHFEEVVSRLAASDTRLVIVEVPSGLIWNPYAGICRRAARRNAAILVPESRLRWWYCLELLGARYLADSLTTDGVHLSPTGAAKVADWLAPYVIRALGET